VKVAVVVLVRVPLVLEVLVAVVLNVVLLDSVVLVFVVLLVCVSVVVGARRNQVTVVFALVQVTFSSWNMSPTKISTACKPIIVIAPLVEMIGYLPKPSKVAVAAATLTTCPMLLLQKPSNSAGRSSVKLFTGRSFLATATPLTLIFPDVMELMPGRAATLLTRVSPSEEELAMDD
jgi:hypothetical protein